MQTLQFAGILFIALPRPPYNDPLMAVLAFAAAVAITALLKGALVFALKKLSARTKNKIDDYITDAFDSLGKSFYTAVGLFVAMHFIQLPETVASAADILVLIFLSFALLRVLKKVVNDVTEHYLETHQGGAAKYDPMIIIFMSRFAYYIAALFAVLIIASNAGFDVNALIAGLGVAGIAIALSLQNILSDVFSSISIYFDKPFKTGDFIILGTDMGIVKKIGIKTTRIQALQGEEIVISNRELTELRIHNFGKMKERRIEFRFGVVYETPQSKLVKIPEIVKKAVEKAEGTRLDRAHFKAFGDSSLNYEVVYFISTGDYNKYMDAQQAINLSLVEQFEKEKIEFAYPTQKVYLAK